MLTLQSIKIRDAVLFDVDEINALCKASKAYWGYDANFMNKFMNQCGITAESIQKNTFKLFFDSEKLIGFYSFAINDNASIPLSLEDFFIHPDYIGQGIGKKMWLHCIDVAQSIGKFEFILEADPNAANFYKKMGCIQVGTRESPIMKHRIVPVLLYRIDMSASALLQALPISFETQIMNTFGEHGVEWLKQLPKLIEYARDKWQLDNLQTVDNLSFNYIASGRSQVFKADIILKISLDNTEFNNEKLGLLYFQGRGINKLFAYDDMHNMLLLEKIGNGVTLKSLFPYHDDEAIEHTAQIIKQLHAKPLHITNIITDDSDKYPTIAQWVSVLDNFNNPVIPLECIALGKELAHDLIHNKEQSSNNQNNQLVLLHGDLHHENILQTHDNKWVAIDPKGVIGNIAYEIGAFMRNPVHELVKQPNLEQILINRINRFSELLDLDKQLLIKYSYLATLLGVIWNFEDNGNHWQEWIKLLPIFKSML